MRWFEYCRTPVTLIRELASARSTLIKMEPCLVVCWQSRADFSGERVSKFAFSSTDMQRRWHYRLA
jgi:hypothetical protein